MDDAIQAAHNVRKAVAGAAISRNNQQIAVTVSGGLATIESNEQVEALIQRADSALYAAKEAGRNCTFLHNGIDCRLAESSQSDGGQSSSSAARLVELINLPDSHNRPVEEPRNGQLTEFGVYLSRETISAELTETCDELRRYLEGRGSHQEFPTAAT
jgi:hypothetical protein